MIKVTGTAVSKWVKSKLWFSLNGEVISATLWTIIIMVSGYACMVFLKAIFG